MSGAIAAGFLGEQRRAFFVEFAPADSARGHILYLPPFAEEMNRCRALVAEQARAFAARGYLCTILDYYGTGEAEGTLEAATLDDWLRNIDDAARRPGGQLPLTLWGCRLGALLAAAYLDRQDDAGYTDLLLWQPLTSGKAFTTQLFRQRAAALLERGEPKEDKDALRERLRGGAALEVGGYGLGGPLLEALEALELSTTAAQPRCIWWLEHQGDDGRPIAARTQRAIDHLRQQAQFLELLRFGGPQLWQLHERDRCEPLLEATGGTLP